MPGDVDGAVDYALDNNPDLAAAREQSKAAGFDVKVAAASRKPKVSAVTTSQNVNYLGSSLGGGPNAIGTLVSGVTASIPCSRAALRLHACVRPRPRRARRWSRKSAPSGR
jgi:outer membrane protein